MTGDCAPTQERRALTELITRARLSSYERSMGSSSGALRLYEWNVRTAASVMELTGMVEVVCRNALDRELGAWSARRISAGSSWFDSVPLDAQGKADLAKARARAARGCRGEEGHGRTMNWTGSDPPTRRSIRGRSRSAPRSRRCRSAPAHWNWRACSTRRGVTPDAGSWWLGCRNRDAPESTRRPVHLRFPALHVLPLVVPRCSALYTGTEDPGTIPGHGHIAGVSSLPSAV